MAKQAIRIAVSQFPVSGDVRANGRYVRRFINQAADGGADLLQISEAALSGYGGAEVKDWKAFDWSELARQTESIQDLVARRGIWLVLGSSHYLDARSKPTNCLYLINPRGEVVDRYDKRFCTDTDLEHYTPGDHDVTFRLKGFKLGLQICYDICFPTTYMDYEKKGVQIMIHSFYNARHRGPTCLCEIGPAWTMVRAADHEMWVFASNACGWYCAWPAMVAAPDGTIQTRMPLHKSGIAIQEVREIAPPNRPYGWLHMSEFRPLYHRGALHNGKPSQSARAMDRRSGPVKS